MNSADSSRGKADTWGPESQQDIDFRKIAALHDLPNQVTECFIHCGYNTVSAVAELDDVNPLEGFLRENYFLFQNSPRRHFIYGLYTKIPEKFAFLPGHKSSALNFIQICKNWNKTKGGRSRPGPTSSPTRARSSCAKSPSLARSIINEYLSDSAGDGARDDANSGAKSVGGLCKAHKSMQPADICEDLKKKLKTWSENHTDKDVRELMYEQHYKIVVKENLAEENQDNLLEECGLQVLLDCCMCSGQIKLQMRHKTIAISNATRHLLHCIKNKDKKSRREKKSSKKKKAGLQRQKKGSKGNTETDLCGGQFVINLESGEYHKVDLNISEGSMETEDKDHTYTTMDSAPFSTVASTSSSDLVQTSPISSVSRITLNRLPSVQVKRRTKNVT